MRGIKSGEGGKVLAFVLLLFAVAVLAAVVSFFVTKEFQQPASLIPTPTAFVPPITALNRDPAEATEKLFKILNRKLEELDLLKLLNREIEIRPVTIQGKVFPTYREEFRMPARYSALQIAKQLDETVQPLGARMSSDKESFSFAYSPEWTPVEILFTAVTKPRICLIIDDGGYKKGEALERLYGLKIPVTLSIIPDVEFSKNLAEELPGHGVEVMCHMPMEGHEKGMMGADYKELLKKGMADAEAKAEVEKALDGLPNCRGLNNHMGSVATTDPRLMGDVCQVLKSRNLFIIDSRTTAQTVVEKAAQKAHVPVAHRDVFLDNVETPDAILGQMKQLAVRARHHGLAVGIGHFKPTTLKTLEEVVHRLRDEGIQFVYASEVVKEE